MVKAVHMVGLIGGRAKVKVNPTDPKSGFKTTGRIWKHDKIFQTRESHFLRIDVFTNSSLEAARSSALSFKTFLVNARGHVIEEKNFGNGKSSNLESILGVIPIVFAFLKFSIFRAMRVVRRLTSQFENLISKSV